jgi:UDP-N-acetylmuramoyl-L-alanyl-D-glutamate--2,6-diaminopimelate ligase
MPPVNLQDLVSHFPQNFRNVQAGLQINGLAIDSRQVRPGDVFFALIGGNSDGHRFIPDAIQRGAAAVVGTQEVSNLEVPYLKVDDGRLALAQLSAAFYNFPAQELIVIGVTGTDGKTTTANLVYSILKSAGIQAGMISTVNAQIGDKVLDTGFHVTTPEAPDVQRYLSEMVAAGMSHVVLEATSHGLAQQRVAECGFDVAVVTNITHEHLDYHGSYEEYRSAKSRLFTDLAATPPKKIGNPRLAVLNKDDGSYEHLHALLNSLETKVNKIDYGLAADADVVGEGLEILPGGIGFTARMGDEKLKIQSPLVGAYNISNCLAAISTANGLGIKGQHIQQGIADMSGIPGRMEVIDLGQEFLAIVDFAHTPNALKRSLQAARQMTNGRVIAVFGSAGLRDKAKRRLMAEISAQLADLTVLTAEDPRIESLAEILEEMAVGARGQGGVEGKSFWRVPDRGEAIKFALHKTEPGDIVISCGKGHEQSMCFEEIEYPWDDRTAMRAALADLLGIDGPEMPYLPTQDDK